MSVDAQSLTQWDYAGCSLSSDPDSFGPFDGLVSLWRSKRPVEGGIPGRKDFDFFDFRGWWGQISIAHIEKDPFDVRFVLWGTQLTDWWGVDYTNKLLGTHSIVSEASQLTERRYFRELAADPFIGVVCGTLAQHDRPFIKIIGVDLPMVDSTNGMSVLSAYTTIRQADTAKTVMPRAKFIQTF